MNTNFKNDLEPALIEFNRMNEKLQAENKRLKAEVRKWKRDSAITSAMFRIVVQGKECTSTKVLKEAERVENLEKENAKLKCLALHAMCRWLDSWSIGVCINIMKHRKFGLFKQIKRHLNYYRQAYCKAKAKLKEGK